MKSVTKVRDEQVPITVTLSQPASALVRWYCTITKHRERAAVEGAVSGALERAKEAYKAESDALRYWHMFPDSCPLP